MTRFDESRAEGAAGDGRRQRLARLCQRSGVLSLFESVRGLLQNDVRILAYHRVLEATDPEGFTFDVELISASTAAFREQMALVKRRFHPLRFDELLACMETGRVPPRSVLITFDDGYDDNYRIAYPILRELGMSATFFVSTGHIESGLPYHYDWLVHMICTTSAGEIRLPEIGLQWTLSTTLAGRRAQADNLLDRLKGLDATAQESLVTRLAAELGMPREQRHPDCQPMTWDQLREMQRNGMEIGSHGVRHRMLAKLPKAQMEEEVRESKLKLEQELGVPTRVLSYPVGGPDAFDADVIEAVSAAGYEMACSYLAGASAVNRSSRYVMRRLPVERQMDAAWFEAMVAIPEAFSYSSRMRER